MSTKKVSPADYKRIFEEMPGGAEVLDEITRRFGREAYVKGGTEGDRETCYRAGQRSVLDFILMRINRADGVNDDVED
ncbi:Bbp19 family protein [Raoultella ornithinolytica]|uniref:Bbp19 family protein n=1 Tax=Raoultella ornithinolytica TaxID=54291 RepID=UPI00403E168E